MYACISRQIPLCDQSSNLNKKKDKRFLPCIWVDVDMAIDGDRYCLLKTRERKQETKLSSPKLIKN